ncbi:MAG: serine hydrolase domain-containing protein, partial [Planctomycetota bacterium]
MRRYVLILSIVLALGTPTVLTAKDSDDPIVAGALGRKLATAVAAAGGLDFWGAVLVAKDGEILLAKGYGKADYASTPNTPRTLFELASASKQVTAAAILHLEQKRKLAVTDSISKHVKGIPEDKHAITIHHLLTHTSGLSGKLGVPYNSPISRKAYFEKVLAPPPVAKPGE